MKKENDLSMKFKQLLVLIGLTIFAAIVLAACAGAEGPAGPAGSVGPAGPQGEPGPAASAADLTCTECHNDTTLIWSKEA